MTSWFKKNNVSHYAETLRRFSLRLEVREAPVTRRDSKERDEAAEWTRV